jgi:hypothetical protein
MTTPILSCQSPVWSGESPLDSRESIFRLPGSHINISPDQLRQSGVHYTLGVYQFGYARLEQIRVRGSRGNRSLSHNIPLTYTLNFRTTISLPRPPRCIIVTHKVCTYAGLFIRRILIGRATDFHIKKVFRLKNSLKML